MRQYKSIAILVAVTILVTACNVKPNNTTNPAYVARQFWDAMIQKDHESARQYVTEKTREYVKPSKKEEEDKRWFDVLLGGVSIVDDEAMVDSMTRTFPEGTKKGEEEIVKGVAKVNLKTIMIRQPDGQWLIDFNRSMISVFGGGLGKLQELEIK